MSPDEIQAHSGLAGWNVRRFVSSGLPEDDLRGVALLELVRCASSFDAGRGIPFAGYASPRIRWALVAFVQREQRHWGNLSLDAELGDEENTASLHDVIPDPRATLPGDDQTTDTHRSAIEALRSLPARQREILALRFLGSPAMTQRAVAARLGVSSGRVAQIERIALDRLRTALSRPPRALPARGEALSASDVR